MVDEDGNELPLDRIYFTSWWIRRYWPLITVINDENYSRYVVWDHFEAAEDSSDSDELFWVYEDVVAPIEHESDDTFDRHLALDVPPPDPYVWSIEEEYDIILFSLFVMAGERLLKYLGLIKPYEDMPDQFDIYYTFHTLEDGA